MLLLAFLKIIFQLAAITNGPILNFYEDRSYPFLDSMNTAVSNFVIIQNLDDAPDKADLLPIPLKVSVQCATSHVSFQAFTF
jgi:hypothetical protein